MEWFNLMSSHSSRTEIALHSLPIEFLLLGGTLILAVVNIFAAANERRKQYGDVWALGLREEPMPPPTPVAARLARAQANLYETLPLFAAAVLAAGVAGRLGFLTALGSNLYFWGRVIYLPVYVMGIGNGIRTMVFMVSCAGLITVILGLFFG